MVCIKIKVIFRSLAVHQAKLIHSICVCMLTYLLTKIPRSETIVSRWQLSFHCEIDCPGIARIQMKQT